MHFKEIEIELTTNCNAACPQCVRNFYGGPVWSSLPLISLDLKWLKSKLGEQLHNTDNVRLCGTYGDPCVHNDFINIIKWLKTYKNLKIKINTNGGMKKNYWKQLASILSNDDCVVFGIDGLGDTNHIYRKNVKWDVLMNNVQSFISAGGNAKWQFIVFEFNQHQVEQAKVLARKLGFSEFVLKKTIRFIDKKHKMVNYTPSIQKNKIFKIYPATDEKYLYKGYKDYNNIDLKNTDIECTSNKLKKIYIGADGYVFPCGWLHDRLYGYEPESHIDSQGIQNLFILAGGKEKANLNYTKLSDIVQGKWFETIEKSWSNENRLQRCAAQCYKGNKILTDVFHSFKSDLTNKEK